MDRVRQLVLDLWQRTRIDWGFATDRIAAAFRREKQLGSSERREVAETLYGMIRQHRRVDHALGAVPAAKRDLLRYLAYRVLVGDLPIAAAVREAPEVNWGEVARVDERIARESSPVLRLALARSLPDWLARRLHTEYGSEADALAAALNHRAPLTLRVNALLGNRETLAERLAKDGIAVHPTRWASRGLVLDTRVNVFGLAAFKEGWFEAQDEASQLVAELVDPPAKAIVVDACAGAGGKTLALGAAMGSRGRLVALDIDEKKLVELRRRARRAKLTSVHPIEVGEREWPDEVFQYRRRAERVLVDAPCSGVGALRRNPEARWRLAEDDVTRLPRQQLAIARQAKELVAPGGRLIYATCTLLGEENEAVAAELVGGGFVAEPPPAEWRERGLTDDSGAYLKLRPDRHDTDGFFAAVLRREE